MFRAKQIFATIKIISEPCASNRYLNDPEIYFCLDGQILRLSGKEN